MNIVFPGPPLPNGRYQIFGKRKLAAFASALGLEAIFIGVAIAWMASAQPKLTAQVIALTIDSTAAPTPPAPAPRAPEIVRPAPPPAKSPEKPAAQLPTLVAAPPDARPAPGTMAATSTPVTAPTAPIAASIAAPPAEPAPAAAVDPAPAYNAKIAAAVQAAFQIPAAAATMGFKGRARVEFSLNEGSANAIRIAVTSGFGAVDRAAVQAVQAATYPAPPAALAGKESAYQIWVACF